MHWLDWILVVSFICLLALVAVRCMKFAGTVVNFLAAGRCAGRYVLSVSEGMAGCAVIGFVGAFEMYYKAGFSIAWWFLMTLAAYVVVSMSGWITYRFRQTRALTISQFLEARYSKRFRIFTGCLAYVSGILNLGIFPAVGARFFLYYCGFPDYITFAGLHISSFAMIMLFLLTCSVLSIFSGGQITIIITDCLQGLFCNIVFVIILVYLFFKFKWSAIVSVLSASPVNESMLHPFQATQTSDFNVWFYIISTFTLFYTWMSWQGNMGYNNSAINPHEARMSKILSNWRSIGLQLFALVIPICAYTAMHHPDFIVQTHTAQIVLDGIGDKTIQTQMTVPVVLRALLPIGLTGLVCMVMFSAFVGNHNTYLHSWGSIFIQDVIMPFRKTPLSPQQHIKFLRWSILFVAVFIFIFSLLYKQNEYILMFMSFTGAIFLSGAGIVVIGGLYWKRGTTNAAWAAMIVGMLLSIAGAVIRRIEPTFPVNSQWIFFITIIICCVVYIVISLLSKSDCFDFDYALKRGKYALAEDNIMADTEPVRGFRALIAMGKEFTTWDKIIYLASLGWTLLLSGIFVLGTIYNLIFDVKLESWAIFWRIYIITMLVLTIIVTIWFVMGGIWDMNKMFQRLNVLVKDDRDDGTVKDDFNSAADNEK
ncbi:MAG: sodium:solute symporter family protein [Sedimentisphaerales bacterium]